MPQRSQPPKHRPKLGQNFLVSPTAQTAIVDALGDLSHRTVVEIGPGRGAITALLAPRARRLIAIELDRDFALYLREQFRERPSVTVVEQDILTTDFAALARTAEEHIEAQVTPDSAPAAPTAPHTSTLPERLPPSGRMYIIGNLPYYITSDILLRLFAAHSVIDRAVIMVQREVATRIAAHPGTSDYGLLSATTQLYARVENLFTLPPSAFSPSPQVHSTVLRLTMAPRFDELQVTPEPFITFLKSCFAQKRKMLAKNLRNAGHASEKIAAALASSNVNPKSRAEELDLPTMATFFRNLQP